MSGEPRRTVVRILNQLRDHPKWGFVIYRCNYRNDEAWNTFIDNWTERVKRELLRQDLGHLIQSLAFTVKEDPTTLDGATVEHVQRLFTAWTESQEAEEERRVALQNGVRGVPRHDYCIHVDAQALDGCLRYEGLTEKEQLQFLKENRDPALGQAAYVSLVRKAREEPAPLRTNERREEDGLEGEDEDEDEDEDEEPVAIKMHMPLVLPFVYTNLLNSYVDQFNIWAKDLDKDGICRY